MKKTVAVLGTVIASGSAVAEIVSFDTDAVGKLPAGWKAGVTGRGAPVWEVRTEPSAPSRPNVLLQSGSGTFPWIVRPDLSFENGQLEVKFKPLSGRQDQAGGLVWRWKDGDNYYVARANALENNVSLYYTQNGRRNTLKYVEAPVAANAWHVLQVAFESTLIRVALDGTKYIEMDDGHFKEPGAVGVWTKADSVTSFDGFTYGAAK